MPNNTLVSGAGTGQERFDQILSQAPFEGLKALLDRLTADRALQQAGVISAGTFEDLLSQLG